MDTRLNYDIPFTPPSVTLPVNRSAGHRPGAALAEGKRRRAAAVQDAGALIGKVRWARSVRECASPLVPVLGPSIGKEGLRGSLSRFKVLPGLVGRSVATGLVAVLVGGTALCSNAAEVSVAAAVNVARPVRGEIHRFVTLPGSLKANQQATLYAKVPGYLKSLHVDRGDRVVAGQALGEIEVPELAADRTKYQAEVRVAETDYRRVSAAQQKAPDLVTPQSVDEAKGRLEIARANLERTETLLKYSNLTAPFAGVVTARFVDPGAFIPSATSGSAAGNAAIVTLMDFNIVRAQVAVPELEAAFVRVGQPVRVTSESLPGKVFEGTVSRQSYALDEATRSVLVEADLPNADLTLRPGMYATIKVGVEKHADTMLIPSAALVTEKSGSSVFIIVDGKAKKTPVKAGFNDGVKAEVLSGLNGSETVILAGKTPPADGAAVTVGEGK